MRASKEFLNNTKFKTTIEIPGFQDENEEDEVFELFCPVPDNDMLYNSDYKDKKNSIENTRAPYKNKNAKKRTSS